MIEASLIVFYFFILVPAYNEKEYIEFPSVDPNKTPNCGLFITQNEAQQYYNNNYKGMKSLSALDRDHDGKVCESLPN